LIGSTFTGELSLRWVVPSDAEVEVDPTSLPLDLVDLALAVFLAIGLYCEQLGVPRKPLQLD
jgi:hypothetical protein